MEVSKTATSTPTEQTRRYRHADIEIMGETHFACRTNYWYAGITRNKHNFIYIGLLQSQNDLMAEITPQNCNLLP